MKPYNRIPTDRYTSRRPWRNVALIALALVLVGVLEKWL
jgi:hypothetical protein